MEMIGNYWLAVLIGLLIGSSITAAGMYVMGFRRVHRGGKAVAVPELDRRPLRERLRSLRRRFAESELRPRTFNAILVLMVLAVVAGLVQITAFTAAQRACNREFQRTIAERADIAADDNRARKEADQAVADLVRGFLAIPAGAPDGRDRARVLLEQFDTAVTAGTQRQQDNESRRAANPYPRC